MLADGIALPFVYFAVPFTTTVLFHQAVGGVIVTLTAAVDADVGKTLNKATSANSEKRGTTKDLNLDDSNLDLNPDLNLIFIICLLKGIIVSRGC